MKRPLKSSSQAAAMTKHTSCDWRSPSAQKGQRCKSRIFRYLDNFKWRGVRTERYKEQDGGWSAISRNILIGNNGETAQFHLRYFELEPNGYSSLEKHRHEHVVICIRGTGNVVIGKKIYELGYLDTVYIAPNTSHQLTNPTEEPFGFFCIVNAERDKPQPVIKQCLE